MNSARWLIPLVLLSTATALCETQPRTSLLAASMLAPPEEKDDRAYAAYKAGYNLILDESWDEARKKFAEVISKHPKSNYVDDAQYWLAYALMHTNTKKAVEAYKKFLERHPTSSYYDDAVADLSQLDAAPLPTPPPDGQSVTVHIGPEGRKVITPKGITITKAPKTGVGYSYSYSLRHLNRELRRAHGSAMWRLGDSSDEAQVDPKTQLKMETLYALAESRDDEKSFQTLKDVALDQKQPRPLRETALNALCEFRKYDALPVYIEAARKDTNKEIRIAAIQYIGEYGKDKNKVVEILVDLFNSQPKQRSEQSEALFYSIAEVGNDKAVDFLTKVAMTHEDYELRTNAVYLLGSIGGEKARSALYQILKGN